MEALRITPLTRDNYVTWRTEISFMLKGEGCYGYVDGSALPVDDKTPRRDVEEYIRRRDRALAIIFQNLSTEYKELINITDSPAEAWTKLKEHFDAPTRANLIRLLDDFFEIKPEPQEPVDIFCARLRKAVDKLKEVNHPVEELYIAFQCIRYLPEDFRGIVQMIYRWPDKDFTLSKIQAELSAEEGRLRQQCRDNLNHLKRTGWMKRGISECESVAGHMYRMSVMAFLLDSAIPGINRDRCIKMSLIHDIAECIVGDLTPFCGVSAEEKHHREVEAMTRLCNLVGKKNGQEFFELFMEYENQQSVEAKAVKDLDKFDMILQAFEYETETKQPMSLQDFFNSTEGTFENSQICKWVEELKIQRAESQKVESLNFGNVQNV